ncbi:Nodulin MtN3 family protein [Striga hermonthica]|uniref:Nodulin MtN3 family protein n=1 Tax=Striga hermonthica TaxID=68872 RepID=A0A9N7MTE3_STRHE|nr:Nodulin MtN3 family protein [Striga hermonthica]
MYASPLAAMKSVVTSKSVEYMPFLLSFCFFLNGGVWSFYAFLQRDWFLGVPNGIGLALGTLQLVLYAMYSNYKPSKLPKADFEDTSQNEPLVSASQQC